MCLKIYMPPQSPFSEKAPKTIKTEYRDKVMESQQCERPKMTANEARKELSGIT